MADGPYKVDALPDGRWGIRITHQMNGHPASTWHNFVKKIEARRFAELLNVVHREAISSLRTAMPDADQIARWKAAEAVAEFDILVEDMEESGIASKFEELKSRGKATLAAYRALTEKQNG